MTSQAAQNVNFYESHQDIGVVEPYAVLSAEEVLRTIRRFVSWATMIATHPDLARSFGEESTTPIKLATDLRAAIKESRQTNTFPNLVLPTHKFMAVMSLMNTSRQLEPVFANVMARESQGWVEDAFN